MSRLTPEEIFLYNLSGNIQRPHPQYMGKRKAYSGLKLMTGQDFGKDVALWEAYLKEHPLKLQPKK
jgi:hypothetical protein